jgi:hypothetical protein
MKLLKPILIASLIFASGISQANPNHGYHHYRGHRHVDWVAPLVIGGVVGYVLTKPQTVIVQQPQPSIPPAPYGYHYENILDANCNCYRLVLVQNQP